MRRFSAEAELCKKEFLLLLSYERDRVARRRPSLKKLPNHRRLGSRVPSILVLLLPNIWMVRLCCCHHRRKAWEENSVESATDSLHPETFPGKFFAIEQKEGGGEKGGKDHIRFNEEQTYIRCRRRRYVRQINYIRIEIESSIFGFEIEFLIVF